MCIHRPAGGEYVAYSLLLFVAEVKMFYCLPLVSYNRNVGFNDNDARAVFGAGATTYAQYTNQVHAVVQGRFAQKDSDNRIKGVPREWNPAWLRMPYIWLRNAASGNLLHTIPNCYLPSLNGRPSPCKWSPYRHLA